MVAYHALVGDEEVHLVSDEDEQGGTLVVRLHAAKAMRTLDDVVRIDARFRVERSPHATRSVEEHCLKKNK